MMTLINISTNCAAYPKISKLPDSASLNLNSSLLFSCHCHRHGIPSYHQLMVKILKVPIQQSVRKPPIPFWDISEPKRCTANPKIAHHHPLHSISYMIVIHLLNTPLFRTSTSKVWVASRLESMVPGLSLSQ